jgi:hypothetical protein
MSASGIPRLQAGEGVNCTDDRTGRPLYYSYEDRADMAAVMYGALLGVSDVDGVLGAICPWPRPKTPVLSAYGSYEDGLRAADLHASMRDAWLRACEHWLLRTEEGFLALVAHDERMHGDADGRRMSNDELDQIWNDGRRIHGKAGMQH